VLKDRCLRIHACPASRSFSGSIRGKSRVVALALMSCVPCGL
jgi:hypothetical protein